MSHRWIAEVLVLYRGVPDRGNRLDAESTAAGVTLGVAGAAALATGLWIRPQRRSTGDVLIVVGASLGAIWFWTLVMTPIAIAVIVGVMVSHVRSRASIAHAKTLP